MNEVCFNKEYNFTNKVYFIQTINISFLLGLNCCDNANNLKNMQCNIKKTKGNKNNYNLNNRRLNIEKYINIDSYTDNNDSYHSPNISKQQKTSLRSRNQTSWLLFIPIIAASFQFCSTNTERLIPNLQKLKCINNQ